MSTHNYERGASTADWLLATAKRNPEGALLVAAGIFLMMRRMGGGNGLFRSAPGSWNRSSSAYPASTGGDDDHDDRRSLMDTARERASEIGGRVRQSAEEVAGYADHIRRAAVDTSSRVLDQSGRALDRTTSTVRDSVGHVVEEQPLALALLGLAAGAAVAALVPPTRIEKRTLGPIGERMTEEAEEAGRRLKDSAAEVGKRLAGEGLSEAARTVARHFTDEPDRASHGQSVSSGPAGSPMSETGLGRQAASTPRSPSGRTTPAIPDRGREMGAGSSDTEAGSSLGHGSSRKGGQADVD